MQSIAMEIPRPVKPGLIVEVRHIDDERITFPMAHRPSHPRICGTLQLAVHTDDTAGAGKFVSHHNIRRRLDDLKRIGHIRGTRNAWQITLHFRIQLHPVLSVFLLFFRCPRLVRNLVALDYTRPAGNAESRAESSHRSWGRRMILNVPVGRVECLPNTIQVGFAIGGPRCAIGRSLRQDACHHRRRYCR